MYLGPDAAECQRHPGGRRQCDSVAHPVVAADGMALEAEAVADAGVDAALRRRTWRSPAAKSGIRAASA